MLDDFLDYQEEVNCDIETEPDTNPEDVVFKLAIDWKSLREQKDTLVKVALDNPKIADDLEGVLSILDYIQDTAVDQGIPEETVFNLTENE